MEKKWNEGSGNIMTLTETVHGKVCWVCNKRFSGRVPAEQHLQSATHVRKVQQQAQQSAHPFWCQVCSLPCNSQQQYATHQDSPRHQHMVKQNDIIRQQHALTAAQALCSEKQSNERVTDSNFFQFLTASEVLLLSREGQRNDKREASPNLSPHQASPILNVCTPEDSPQNLSPSSSPDLFSPKQSSPVDVVIKMNPSPEIPPGGLIFDGSRGHCYLCNIELTSLQHKSQHVEGKQHKKKALMIGSNVVGGGGGGLLGGSGGPMGVAGAGSGIMMCSICKVPLSGQLNVEQHFSSPKHKARKAQHDRQAATASESTFMQPGATPRALLNPSPLAQPSAAFPDLHGADSIPGRQISFPGQLRSNVPVTSHQQPGTDRLQPPGVTPPSPESAAVRFEWVKGKGICHMCDQQFQTLEESSQHLVSPEHKQREEDISKPGCTLCGVQYSSSANAVQHLNSETHKKLVVFMQGTGPSSAGSQPLPGDLPVLSEFRNQVSLTSSQLSHRMSNVHQLEETVRKVAISYPSTMCRETNDAPSQPVSLQAGVGIQETVEHTMLNALDEDSRGNVPLTHLNILPSMSVYDNASVQHQQQQQQKQQSPPAEYHFNGVRGFCNVCNIELTSKAHAESHLAGAKHNKAVSRWQLSSFAGLLQGENPAHREIQGTQVIPNNECQEATPTSYDQAEKQKVCYQFDGNRGRCFACKIDLSSDAHAKQHLVGKKHQAAAERWLQEADSGTMYPLYCDVCHKPFTGQESAAQHFSSDKHKKKVSLAEGASQGKKDPETGALIIQRDGQTWYMCEVCKVPLNTPEQFRLHVNSPRHNAEVEKAKMQEHSNRSSPIDAPNFQAPIQTSMYQAPTASSAAEVIGNNLGADPSDYQHLVKKSSVMITSEPYAPLPQSSQMSTSQLINSEPRLLQTGLTRTESAGQSFYWPHNTTSGLPQDNAALGRDSAFTGYSTNGVMRGRGRAAYHCMQFPDRNSASVSPGGVTASATQNHQHAGVFGNPSSVLDNSLSSMNAHGLGHGRGSSGHRFSGDIVSDMGLAARQNSHSSSGRRSAAQVLRPDGDYDDEYDNNDQKVLPTASSSADYQDRDGEDQHNYNATVAISEFSTIQGGDELSMTASEKRQMTHSASSVTNNDTSIYSDAGSVAAIRRLPAVKETTPDPQQPLPEPNPFKGFRYSCRLCMQPMNTKEDHDRHMKGLRHQMKAATVSAPDKSGEELKKVEDKSFEEAYKCVKTMPRTYQVELMCKAMASDSSVVYLPTGTGKTLAAMMTLSRMLTLNPTRPVLFLVDKVLLVLQQARYIINELGGTFLRPDLTDESDKLVERNLKVAVLCGGLSVRDGTPLWKHDVIVTTAAFCQNLLQEKVLRWANFSLVVFDEAHHCTKNHPYNKLLLEHHIKLSPQQRPKVLGLTASPAGRRTKEETLDMLKNLLKNLGGATIATIEEQIAKEQLDSFSSSARLVPVCVPMTEAEMGFHEKLLSYFIQAYVELMRCSNLQQINQMRALQNLLYVKPPKPDDVKKFAQHLMSEPDELSEMVQLAQTARIKSNTVPINKFDNIRMHVMTVGMTLLNSEDGIDFVLDDLERLFNPNLNTYFHELTDMGLPCKEIATYVNTLCDSAKLRAREEGEKEVEAGGVGASPSTMSIFQELLCTLANSQYMNWESSDSMALVLVRERKVAHKFKDHLKRTSFVRERSMKVAVVVGHGAGSGEGEGMNLRKQDKVLQGIKSHRYNIVVATSVAEEGVDIPECQLVVSLNPPTTVKALVQMRGRARKKDSYFVVLCSSQREKEKLEDLQKQELNMKWAAAQLTQQHAMLGL